MGGLFKKRILKLLDTAYKMQYSSLGCKNNAEVGGLIRVGLAPSIERIIEEAKKEFYDELFGGKEVEINSITACMNYHDEYTSRLLKLLKKWFGGGETD